MLARKKNNRLYMERKRMATRLDGFTKAEYAEKKMIEDNKKIDRCESLVLLFVSVVVLTVIILRG